MFFTVLDRNSRIPKDSRSQVFLIWDNWNDYNFYTLFGFIYVDSNGHKHDLGGIVIGFMGQKEKDRALAINDTFEKISDSHFSVGGDDGYYVQLNKFGIEIRDQVLFGLNDIAKNTTLLKRVSDEEVFKVSFLRGSSLTTIEGQYSRLAVGAARLTPYDFSFTTPSIDGVNPMSLSYEVKPFSNPPTNIHILIGRNGIGKTFMINSMIDSLTKRLDGNGNLGIFEYEDQESTNLFANLICITFSAFDEFDHPPEQRDKSLGIHYSYIGLKSVQSDGTAEEVINPGSLTREFLKSIGECKGISKSETWKGAISMLNTDPIFKSEDIAELIDCKSDRQLKANAQILFKKLSSGHKLVLLTITKLVEKLEERSLVLIDEPESHLHPPLLSSFMRALAELLIHRNAVSIIATHSPVVLQEVPKSCVWKLRRNGAEAIAERLQIESFGENVGVLTQEIFGLEVTESGFHQILRDLSNRFNTYDGAIEAIGGQLGLEGRSILRGMFFKKQKE